MFYEDFQPGQVFKTNSRTVTATDIELFTSLTWAVNPLFLSEQYARERGFSTRIAPGALVIAFAIGLLYQTGIFDHIIALAGIEKLAFKSPTHMGDVIAAKASVAEKRETQTVDRGLVKLHVQCLNLSRNTTAFEAEMVFVMLRKSLSQPAS
ncbi:MAG: MaoC/PaaZ C-terminal domain-containing protein [Candidatus Caldarchaeum sp.]